MPSPIGRIAPLNRMAKHDRAIVTLSHLIIELKIAAAKKAGEDWGREPEDLATDEWIAKLEEAVDDIETCWEPIIRYHHNPMEE